MRCMCIFSWQFPVFYSCKKLISVKNAVLPKNAIMWQHIIIQFSFYYLSGSRLREVKNKRNFKLLASKVVVVAYERWSPTRGSKYSNLTGKRLVFWKVGCHGQVVVYERRSQLEVPPYLFKLGYLKDSNAAAHSVDSDIFHAVIH